MAYDLQMEFLMPGTPKQVMEMLTDTKLIRKWSGEEAVLEKMVGGRFEMFDGWVTGKVLKMGDKELAYSWKTTDWNDDEEPSEVHYLLSSDKEGTKVLLKHTNLPTEEEMKEHKIAWDEHFFGPMEEYMHTIIK
jgi:activator of HSP90 ATPase